MQTMPSGELSNYRALLQQHAIPYSRRSYYVRWLNLYLAACRQNRWAAGDPRHLEPFIATLRDRHPSAFLQQQAREAVQLFLGQKSCAKPPGETSLAPAVKPLQPATADDQLEAIARRVKARTNRSIEDMLAIGKDLNQAKALLPRGRFRAWIAAEFDMSYQTANRLMRAAEHFSDKVLTVRTLSLRALYELSAPGTSARVRADVIRRLAAGERVSFAQIRTLKQAGPDMRMTEPDRGASRRIAELSRQMADWLQRARTDLGDSGAVLDGQGKACLVELHQRLMELDGLVLSRIGSDDRQTDAGSGREAS